MIVLGSGTAIPPAGAPAPAGGRRWPRALWASLLGVIALLTLATASLRIPAVGTSIANAILRAASPAGFTLAVRDVRGDWLTRLDARGFQMSRGESLRVTVDTLSVRWNAWRLLLGRIQAREIAAAGVSVSIVLPARREAPAGPGLSLGDVLNGRFYHGPRVALRRISLRRGGLAWLPPARDSVAAGSPSPSQAEFRRLEASLEARDLALGHGFSFTLDSLRAQTLPMRGADRVLDARLAGKLARGGFELRDLALATRAQNATGGTSLRADAQITERGASVVLHARRFPLQDLDLFAPGLGFPGALEADLDLRGPRLDRVSGTVMASLDSSRLLGAPLAGRLDAPLDSGAATPRLSARWGGARITVTGAMRPLDAAPTYDLMLSFDRPPFIPGQGGWQPVAQRAALSGQLRVRGRGYGGAVLDVSGHGRAAEGAIALQGHLDCTRGVAWELSRVTVERMDVALLAGDTTSSAVSGTLRARGQSAGPDSTRIEARAEIGESFYGPWRIASASARGVLDGSRLDADVGVESDAGTLKAGGMRATLSGASTFHVAGARVEHLDLARLTQRPDLTSDLNATLDADGRGLTAAGGIGGPLAALRDGRLQGDATLRLEPSRLRGRVLSGGSAHASVSGGDLSANVQLDSDAGRLEASARGRPFADPPGTMALDGHFADLDVAAWAGTPPLGTSLSGTLRAEGRPPPIGGPDRFGSWTGALDLSRFRVGGVVVDDLAAHGEVTGGRARGSVALDVNRRSFRVDVQTDLSGPEPRGRASGSVPFATLAAFVGRDSLPCDGEIGLDLRFNGTSPATAEASLDIVGRGTIVEARVDTLLARLRLTRGALVLDTLALQSNVGRASGSGTVVLGERADTTNLSLAAALADPMPLAPLIGADTLGLGSGTLTARLTGPRGARRLEAQAELRSIAWNDLRLLGAQASVSGTLDRSFRPSRLRIDGSANRFQGGVMRFASARFSSLTQEDSTEADAELVLDAKHRIHAAGGLVADSASQRLALREVDVQGDSVQWRLEHPTRLRLAPDRLEVDGFALRSAGGRITAQGVIDRRGTQDFRLDLNGVQLDLLSLWIQRKDLGGQLNGRLALAGSAASPRGNASLDVSFVSSGKPAGTFATAATWEGTRLSLNGRFATPGGDSLTVVGSLPFAISLAADDSAHVGPLRAFEGDVDLRVLAHQFPLRGLGPLVDAKLLRELGGTLDVDATLGGTSRALSGRGGFAIVDGQVTLPPLGVTYKDIAASGRLDGNRLVLSDCHAVSGKGSLRVDGQVRLHSLMRVEPDLSLSARKFVFVDAPDLRALASGDLKITGSLTAPVAKGNITVQDSYFYMTQAAEEGAEGPAAVPLSPEDIRALEATFGYATSSGADPATLLFDASDLDLDVSLERNTWVRQRTAPRLAVELTGRVKVTKPPHTFPNLVGRIEPVPGHGYIEQFARSFDFTGGEVLLNGGMKDHSVDIHTEYRVGATSESDESDVVVRLDVDGRLDKLRLTLSSEPPLSETEIINYIATGKAPPGVTSSSSGGGSDASLATDIALSQVTGAFEDVAQQSVGLDVLQVRFDARQGATLVAGRYIDPQLYVGFRQPLQQNDTSTTNQGSTVPTRFEVEYAAYRWLVLNVQGETAKLRSFIRARHAY